jgi:lysophospholipase L1-like esterase
VRESVDGYRDLSFAERTGHALAATRLSFAYVNLGRRDARLREVYEEQLEDALRFDPDLVLVVAGGNDALRADFDASRVRVELFDVLAPLRSVGAQPVTVGLFDLARSGLVPAPHAAAMAERFDRLDAVTRDVAAELQAIHVDTHHHPLAADPAIFSSDGVHANARGHAVAAAAIATALADALPG